MPTAQGAPRAMRYFEFVAVAFVVVLVCSNLIGPSKPGTVQLPIIGALTFGAGALFFPMSYVLGDVLTEVYGYSRARRVIWAGFAALVFAALMAAAIVALPTAPGWPHQKAFETAFGHTWRIAGASIVAYFCGELVNAYVLARMKVASGGRWMAGRFVASTLAGEAVDSALFYPLAFWGAGLIPDTLLPTLVVSQFLLKTGVEIVFLPVSLSLAAALKKAEHEDHFDRDTDFNPFHVRI
jgi:uncharacterized integral membrane protein (TIGR00697 family)